MDAPGRIINGLTRRRLLVSGGAAGAAALTTLNPQLASAITVVGRDPAYLRRASYSPLVGQDFTASWWGGSITLTLADVGDLDGGLEGRDDAFSLLFTGSPGLASGRLTLSHPRVGRFPLFVGPVDPRSRAQEYEAIVNRSVGLTRRPAKPPRHRQPRPHWEHPRELVRDVAVERAPHGLRLEVELSHRSRARRVHVWLRRDGRVLATAGPRRVHDHRVVLHARTERRLRRGRYELVVAAGERLEPVTVEVR